MIINKKNAKKRGLRPVRLGCPLTHNRTPWCFNLCVPDDKGDGFCGRVAPYHLKSNVQRSIENYKKKLENEASQTRSAGR